MHVRRGLWLLLAVASAAPAARAERIWFDWKNPSIKQWTLVGVGRDLDQTGVKNDGKMFAFGGVSSKYSLGTQLFAVAETSTAFPVRRRNSLKFTAAAGVRVAYKPENNNHDPWNNAGVSALAGISFRQKFQVFSANPAEAFKPNALISRKATATVTGLVESFGERVFEEPFLTEHLSGLAEVRVNIVPAPLGYTSTSTRGILKFKPKQDTRPWEAVNTAIKALAAMGQGNTTDMAKAGRKLLQLLFGKGADHVGVGEKFGQSMKLADKDDPIWLVEARETYELQVDAIFSASQKGGYWGRFGRTAEDQLSSFTVELALAGGGANVPEPASLFLLIVGSLPAFRRCRRFAA